MSTLGNSCAAIADGADFNCAAPPIAGVLADILLMNKNDILSVTRGGTLDVTALALKTGAKVAYKVQGVIASDGTPSAAPSAEYRVTGQVPGFGHTLAFGVLDKSAATLEDFLAKVHLTEIVALVETKDSVEPFVVFGLDHGMKVSEGTRDYNNADNGGTWNITLTTPSNLKETLPPARFFDTDYATTAAKVTGLLTPTAP